MSNISIVTAFYDIGRGDWTPDKGFPHYLERNVETYMKRFSYLCNMKTDITVFTSKELFDTVREITKKRNYKTTISIFDPFDVFEVMRQEIETIQNSKYFQSKLIGSQKKNPEYWNKDYVLITNLKAFFVDLAIKNNMVSEKNNLVSWIDFGYCRSEKNIPKSREWNYNFNMDKIHLFAYKNYDNKNIEDIVFENDVYILGAKIVANKELWQVLSKSMINSYNEFILKGIVDDDQGHWLNCFIKNPNMFQLNFIPDHQLGHDCFVLFNEFNDTL